MNGKPEEHAIQRWAACLEYDGSGFSGLQRQPHAPSVQGVLEAALSQIANHEILTHAAGRTDAGVHAFAQVLHFDSSAARSERAWLMGGNANMPDSVSLRWVVPVSEEFHARFSAEARSYRYVIYNGPARSALLSGRVAHVANRLNEQAMHEAAQCLLGEQDFSAFRAAQCQSNSPMRFVESVSAWRQGDFVMVEITANAFVHHMVRNIVGSLIPIGEGRADAAWLRECQQAGDRSRSGPTAPAEGLYFVCARYPSRFALPPMPAPWFPVQASD